MIDDELKDYRRYVLDDVRVTGEMLTISYGGNVFGGIVRCQLDPDGVEASLKPGAEILIRYHEGQGGVQGPVAHVIMLHPRQEGWAELFSDEA